MEVNSMIARLWRGVTPADKADAYLAYLEATGVQDYAAVPGNRGVQVLRRVEDGCAEFLLISLWDSFDAIRVFAGDDIERAVYYPEDANYLLTFEPTVTHYDVLVQR
jgi:heme-degrading monooxygenase HmoA